MHKHFGHMLAVTFLFSLSGSVFADGFACPPQGDAKSDPVKALNVLKNQDILPTWGDFYSRVTLPAVLVPRPDAPLWSDSKAVTINGYVIEVKPDGLETVNCHVRDLANRDTRIEIALAPGAPKTSRMIIEVPP